MARRMHRLRGISVGLLILFCASSTPAKDIYSTWICGTSNYSKATCWDPAIVPSGQDFTVDIPTNKGIVTLDVDAKVKTFYLYENTTFTVPAGRTYDVNDQAAIYGTIDSRGGGFTASKAYIEGMIRVNGGSFTVRRQADIYGMIDANGGDFTASNAILHGDKARVWARRGAQVKIPAGAYSAIGLKQSDTLISSDGKKADGTASLVNLSALTELNDGFSVSGARYAHGITAQNNGVIDLSRLTTIITPSDDEYLDIRVKAGGRIDLSSLKTLRHADGRGFVWFRLDGEGTTLDLPTLSLAEFAAFEVKHGAKLSAALLTYSAAGLGADQSLLLSDGTGSVLSLSAVTELNDGFSTSDPNRAHSITAQNGGEIDLSGLKKIIAPSGDEHLDIVVSSGGSIRLDRLASVSPSDASQWGYVWFKADGKDLELPSLSSVSSTLFHATKGAKLKAAGSPSSPSFTYWATDLDAGFRDYTLLSSDGEGSLLDLSAMTALNDAFSDGYENVKAKHKIVARHGGAIDLSHLATITGPKDNEQLHLTIDGGTIDASSLQTIDGSTGGVYFNVVNGGKLLLGNVNAKIPVTITLNHSNDLLVGSRDLNLGAVIALSNPGQAGLVLRGDFRYAHTEETKLQLRDSRVSFVGEGPQELEVGGLDVDTSAEKLTTDNFGVGQIVIGEPNQPAVVFLVDHVNNGNRYGYPEALYLFGKDGQDGLRIEKGSVLYLGGLKVYAMLDGMMTDLNTRFAPGQVRVLFDQGSVCLGSPDVNDCRNVIQNGDFENGVNPPASFFRALGPQSADLAPWEIAKNMVNWTHETWFSDAGAGHRFADLSSANDGKGVIRQTFDTPQPGTLYHVWFDVAPNPYGDSKKEARVTVSAAGGSEEFPVDPALRIGPMPTLGKPWPVQWRTKTWRFVATEARTTLTFAAGDDPSTPFSVAIDNVVVLSPGSAYPPDCFRLKSWSISGSIGTDPNHKQTKDTTPELTFVFSKPAAGADSDIVIRGPAGQLAKSVSGWKSDVVKVTFAAPLQDGRHTVTLKSTILSMVGEPLNGDRNDTIVSFALDTTAPVLVPHFLSTTDPSPELTGKINDPDATVKVTIAGKTYTARNNRNGTWTLPNDTIQPALNEGTYVVTVTATDPAGNECIVYCEIVIKAP